jgi:hypothetical protein
MNSTSITLSADEHKTLEVLLAALPDSRAQVSAPDCTTYQTYRPILQAALPLIQRIPVFGSKIFSALSFLMALADGVCNVSAADVSPGGDTGQQPATRITVEKSGANELRVTLPQGSTINSNNISEADLYFALSQHLVKVSRSVGASPCLIDITPPKCLVDL